MHRIVDLYKHGESYSGESIIMVRAALCEFRLNSERNIGLPDYLDSRINHFVYEIRNNPGNRYTIDEIADKLCCSKNQCIRRFRKYTGLTPIQLVNRIKTEIAKQHLIATSFSVSEIAEILGFCDMYYFSKVFKQFTGMSPSAFRAK